MPLLALLVREAPEDGRSFYLLGRSHERTGDLNGAIDAYRSSFDQGYGRTPSTAYRIARLYARRGAADSADASLEQSLALRYERRPELATDTTFASLRNDARFRRLAAIADTAPASREVGWRSDIDYLVEEARRMNANPDRPAFAPSFDSAARDLKARVGELTDAQVVMELRRLLVLLGDGHTGIYGVGTGSPVQTSAGVLPLETSQFSDGLFVIDGRGDAGGWIGARVVRIQHFAADLVAALPTYVHHDNEFTALWLGEHYLLPTTDFLRAVGAMPPGNARATLTLRMPGVPRSS